MSPQRQRLIELLQELHTELQQAEVEDSRGREALREAIQDLDAALQRSEERHDESLVERLREAALELEGSHPTLFSAVGRVVDQLAKMGI